MFYIVLVNFYRHLNYRALPTLTKINFDKKKLLGMRLKFLLK